MALSVYTPKNIQTLDGMRSLGGAFFTPTMDASTASGMAFLNAELEKIDPTLHEPLTSVTWQRDITSRTGGGWVEYTSAYHVDYGTTGGNADGIIGGQTTDIPIAQADVSKDKYKVFTWANILKVPYVDQQKLNEIGRNLENIMDSGIRLNYQKTLDINTYLGFGRHGMTGLLNDINVITTLAANGAAGSRPWSTKTPDEVLHDINIALTTAWSNSEYDLSGMPNHVLVPPIQYAWLVSQKVSDAGNISVLQYLLDNNIGRNQGVDVMIFPSRWCTGAGAGGLDRMMVYANAEDRVRFDITVTINRVMTQPSVEQMAYLSAYVAQIGQVVFLYYQPALYTDGI